MGHEVAIFQHKLQISSKIPTDSSKFPTEEITGAQNSDSDPKFSQNRGLSVPNFAFPDKFPTR